MVSPAPEMPPRKSRSKRVAGRKSYTREQQTIRTPRAVDPVKRHWTRRTRTWVIGAILAGLGVAISGIVSQAAETGVNKVIPIRAAGGRKSSSGVESQQLPLVQLAPSANATQNAQIGSLEIATQVETGLDCPPAAHGMVFPRSLTPGLNASVEPGTGPTHEGKTWDQSPGLFGAVPAGPVEMYIYLTGPTSHAVTITGLKIHVISRKPQVDGQWFEVAQGCGAGGNYHYGIFDLDTSAPYQLPITSLPQFTRADALRFPYFTSATNPDAFDIKVQSEHCDCTWDADLTWVDGATAKSLVIDDHGHPFESTSVTGLMGTWWTNSSNSAIPNWTSQRFTSADM